MSNEQVKMLLDIGHLMRQIEEAEEGGHDRIDLDVSFLKDIIAMAIEGDDNDL